MPEIPLVFLLYFFQKSDISDKEFEKMLGDESDVDDPKDRKKRKRKRNSVSYLLLKFCFQMNGI